MGDTKSNGGRGAKLMGCLIPLLAVLMPRFSIIFFFALTDWFGRAYESCLGPILGFFFMPYTVLAYMVGMLNNSRSITGQWLVYLMIAVVVDILSIFIPEQEKKRS